MSLQHHNVNRNIYRLGRVALLMLLYLMLVTGTARAADKILGVQVISESVKNLTLKIDYEYGGARGSNVFVSAKMAEKGKPSRYYAVRPARVAVGKGSANVKLGTAQSAPEAFTSDALIITMYVGGQNAFLSQSFNYRKTWSKAGVALPASMAVARLVTPAVVLAPQAKPESAPGVTRQISDDGVVELRYADGTIKRVYPGGVDIVRPNGSVMKQLHMEAQPPTPPSAPPNPQHEAWLQSENQRLLNIIGNLVANDEASVSNYLDKEGTGLSPYERITRRTTTINFLLTP
jgi:hypothetical protein